MYNSVRFEIMPFESVEKDLDHFDSQTNVAVTTSPKLGIDRTVEFCSILNDKNLKPIPHIAARFIENKDKLDEILSDLKTYDVDDIFVPGGDREDPLGEFESSYDLLLAMEDLGYEFNEIGITGYPEGHKFLSEKTLSDSLKKKEDLSTYIVTQICFDPDSILDWTKNIRNKDISNDIHIGVPGVIEVEKMLKISKKVGVGDSIEFLKKTTGIIDFIKNIIGSKGRYYPDDLVESLQDSNIEYDGMHLYTFNRIKPTFEWYQKNINM